MVSNETDFLDPKLPLISSEHESQSIRARYIRNVVFLQVSSSIARSIVSALLCETLDAMRDASSDESIMKDGEDVARIEMGAENYDMSRK